MRASYQTVLREGRAFLTEKKSKFIASVMPTPTEEEALAFLTRIRSEFPDARHNVYAYVIDENHIFRYSDDGEPAQTAGMPVLDVIRKEGLVDVTVVVTRYFGGILLGTGGLVHMYSSSAKQGLLDAKIITRMLCNLISVKVDYTLVGKVQYAIAAGHYPTEEADYGQEVTFYVLAKIDQTDAFLKQMTELTNGRAVCTVLEQKWVDEEGGA